MQLWEAQAASRYGRFMENCVGTLTVQRWPHSDQSRSITARSSSRRYDLRDLGGKMDPRTLRKNFVAGLYTGLHVVWPILSALLLLIVALGFVIGVIEGWSVHESNLFRVRIGADDRLR